MVKLARFLALVSALAFLFLFSPPLDFAQARQSSSCPMNTLKAVVNVTASGDTAVIAASPSKRLFVWQWFFVNSHGSQDENVTIKEGATAISGAYLLNHAGGAHTAPCTGTPWSVVPKGSAFTLNLSASGSVQGTVYYTPED